MAQKSRKNIKKRTRNKEGKRETIRFVALRIIMQEGYEKLTTNRIAEETEISIGAIYHLFPKGKPEIVQALIQEIQSQYLPSTIFEEAAKQSFHEFISLLLQNFVHIHRKNLALVKASADAFGSNAQLLNEAFDGPIFKNQAFFDFLMQFPEIKGIPPIMVKNLLIRTVQIAELLIHNHILTDPPVIFRSDDELVEYLESLLVWELGKIQNTHEKW